MVTTLRSRTVPLLAPRRRSLRRVPAVAVEAPRLRCFRTVEAEVGVLEGGEDSALREADFDMRAPEA